MIWKFQQGGKETDLRPVALHSRQELRTEREGCLKAHICCDQQLEVFGVLMLENIRIKKCTTIEIDIAWTHRMLPELRVVGDLDPSTVAHHHGMDL